MTLLRPPDLPRSRSKSRPYLASAPLLRASLVKLDVTARDGIADRNVGIACGISEPDCKLVNSFRSVTGLAVITHVDLVLNRSPVGRAASPEEAAVAGIGEQEAAGAIGVGALDLHMPAAIVVDEVQVGHQGHVRPVLEPRIEAEDDPVGPV